MTTKPYKAEYQEDVKRYINLVMVMKNLTWRDVAKLMDQSHQNLNNKVQRGSLNATELFKFAERVNCSVRFVDNDTGKILI